jgi:hypothetical protein
MDYARNMQECKICGLPCDSLKNEKFVRLKNNCEHYFHSECMKGRIIEISRNNPESV